MKILPLRKDLQRIINKHNLYKKFQKQKKLFIDNPNHPSLHREILRPKHLRIYSFRIDRKWRAIFVVVKDQAEIIDINLHYQ